MFKIESKSSRVYSINFQKRNFINKKFNILHHEEIIN